MNKFADDFSGHEPATTITAVIAGQAGLTIRLAGELDGAGAAALREQLHTTVATVPSRDVVVDLSDVEFCDAAIVRVFVVVAATVTGHGADFRLRGARPHIHWLFERLGAGHLLSVD